MRQPKPASAPPKGYRRLIPSVTVLVEFEAVARLGSFTLAAHELGVTQAATAAFLPPIATPRDGIHRFQN